MMLVKVRVAGSAREDVKRIADIFRGRILDVTQSTYIIEVTGDGAKLDAFINALDRSSIIELVRSGSLAIGRGEKGSDSESSRSGLSRTLRPVLLVSMDLRRPGECAPERMRARWGVVPAAAAT